MGPFEVIKMSNITTEKANELFWLGRYVERVYTPAWSSSGDTTG